MASIFTYDPNPARVSSPWSTPGSMTPTSVAREEPVRRGSSRALSQSFSAPVLLQDTGITRLEAEPQEGSTEYKLHLLLRPRRTFSSSTTGMDMYGSSNTKHTLSPPAFLGQDLQIPKSGYAPSNLTRQMRLQQLTTQLLWRLQQSSPFHSTSPGDLVLPKLPEASPKLGVPTKRAALLPGLEESQGALYEIGVSDDGVLVGLIEEELEESLVNLRAMAASLGCIVEVLRKVAVGECEWFQSEDGHSDQRNIYRGTLWVAEALVRPDVEAEVEGGGLTTNEINTSDIIASVINSCEVEAPRSKAVQVRITLTGNTAAGKSSLLGTLSTSTLDNGRGKSRISLLRHRHEITTGVTSSVAQELIGYSETINEETGKLNSTAINYATPDVSSWIDIHHLADRLVFLSDSPGQARYAKSIFRTLVSWNPHWTLVCVSADESELENGKENASNLVLENTADVLSSLTYIALCLKLNLPMVIAITKMDLATKFGLRSTLSRVLSALKEAGRKPTILSHASLPVSDIGSTLQNIHPADQLEIDRLITSKGFDTATVPIVLTSAITGLGIGKLHALLSSLPLLSTQADPDVDAHRTDLNSNPPATVSLFHIDEVFMIPPSKVYGSHEGRNVTGHGIVLCGRVAQYSISIGDSLILGPFAAESVASETRRSSSVQRSSPCSASLGKSQSHLNKSLVVGTKAYGEARSGGASAFVDVKVVSIRNLRLPVRTLLEDQVGTVGVELVDHSQSPKLSRARKGMVLTHKLPDITPYGGITATFAASDFADAASPTLILGGHAVVYVNTARAAVKVTSLVTISPNQESSPVFDFEEEQDDLNSKEIRITFRFISSVEWVSVGDKILVIPNASTTGPVAGPVSAGSVGGLSGFVGRICEGIV